jgi:crotonobetainyl-CoA:carnitine CoA-transferase CaiB-like acyl-CoA transferase
MDIAVMPLPDVHGNRTYGPPFLGGESAYFLSVNHNKRSCAIDLKSPAGEELVRRLAGVADVVIENFRPGTMERLDLGYESLSQYNRRLILCVISGFGRTGADANRPGYDLILQGESGVMDITGDVNGPPRKVGTPIADLVTDLYATQAVLAALRQRDCTGCGGRVDVAMLDAMVSLLTFNAGIYFATGKSPQRRGNVHPTISPYETFEAADGSINIGVANDKFWSLFCDVIDRADLRDDGRFSRARDRAANPSALVDILTPILRARSKSHWARALSEAGIPSGEIRTVGEVCEAPQLRERGTVGEYDHPVAGRVRYVASAVRFDDRATPSATRPPLLGEHTSDVITQWLKLTPAEIRAYAEAGAFCRRVGTPVKAV